MLVSDVCSRASELQKHISHRGRCTPTLAFSALAKVKRETRKGLWYINIDICILYSGMDPESQYHVTIRSGILSSRLVCAAILNPKTSSFKAIAPPGFSAPLLILWRSLESPQSPWRMIWYEGGRDAGGGFFCFVDCHNRLSVIHRVASTRKEDILQPGCSSPRLPNLAGSRSLPTLSSSSSSSSSSRDTEPVVINPSPSVWVRKIEEFWLRCMVIVLQGTETLSPKMLTRQERALLQEPKTLSTGNTRCAKLLRQY